MKKIIILTLCLFISCLFISMASLADSISKFKKIMHTISELKINLLHEKKQKNTEEQKLKNIEINIGELTKRLQNTEKRLVFQQHNLKRLNQKEKNNQQKLDEEQTALASQMRAAYMLGNQQYLKMLFNQHDISTISRISHYYRYFIEKRLQLIQSIRATLTTIKSTRQQIQQSRQQLTQLHSQLQQQQQRQEHNKTSRRRIVKTLNAKIHTKQAQLANLLKNKHALAHAISQAESRHQPAFTEKIPFNQLRGKLAWPTSGQLIRTFGEQIQDSELKLQGVVIHAPLGQKVYAIASGHVVFANWMPGYGLLLIINHGDGYMTIYGRNNALFIKTGDIVAKGQMITEVGESGGHNKSSLYFSIRHNGKALNPRRWCQGLPTRKFAYKESA